MNGDKSVEEIKKAAVGAAREAAQEVKESVEATAEDMENVPEVHLETPEADVEVTFIDDRDKEAEGLIHWAAARAGVIVAAPLLGTVSLIANEVYMISKIGSVYGVDVPQKAVLSFIGSLGATVVGTTVATLLPIPFIQIPIGISVTYGLGKAAVRWIKDGMPDDTRPYKAVFEEGRAEGNTLVGEIKENPEKDIPLGDEKREIKKTVDDVYPEKAHEAVDKLADQLVDTFNLLGEQLVTALKKAGMTDEQIEKAKYTTIGAAEIAKETAEKTAKNLRAVARVKSRKLQEEARQKASEMKEQAKEQMEELQKKKEEMRRQSEIRAEQAKLKSEKLKAQARIQMQEAKVQADKLKEQVRTQAEIAQDKANELKEKVNARADDYRRNVSAAANRAKADILGYVDDFRTRTEERAAQIRAKDRNAKGGAIEGSEFSQETVGKSSEETKK